MMGRFYKQGILTVDLMSIDVIDWAGGTCQFILNNTHYINPEFCDETADLELDELYQLRYDQLIEQWMDAKDTIDNEMSEGLKAMVDDMKKGKF